MSFVSVSWAVLTLCGPCKQKIAGARRGHEASRYESAMPVLMVVHAGEDLPVHDWEDIFVLVKKL